MSHIPDTKALLMARQTSQALGEGGMPIIPTHAALQPWQQRILAEAERMNLTTPRDK